MLFETAEKMLCWRIKLSIRTLIVSAIVSVGFLTPATSFASNVPERFRGVWQVMESGEAVCKASDWDTDLHTDTHVRIEPGLVRYHESECRFRTIAKPQLQHDAGAIRITMSCEGEGEKWQLTEVWQSLDVLGRTMLAKTNVDKRYPSTILYQKCQGGEGADRIGKPNETNVVSAPAGGSDLRAVLDSGRHCFAQKEEGAELYLDIAAGTAFFSLDVANPRTKHLCSLSGTANRTPTGWRYVDDSQKDQQCSMDMNISDRISFRLNASECERRYCGARASVEALEFSARDRKKACPAQRR